MPGVLPFSFLLLPQHLREQGVVAGKISAAHSTTGTVGGAGQQHGAKQWR
ncbi:MAG TPA: hypothetical protein VF629_06265 [Hymenobacter sp.]